MLQKLKIPIIIVVTAILTQLAGYAVHAAMPDALLAAGTTRYAAISYPGVDIVADYEGWVDMTGMIKYIAIPTGHTADVLVIFCGNSRHDRNRRTVYARAMIGTPPPSRPLPAAVFRRRRGEPAAACSTRPMSPPAARP